MEFTINVKIGLTPELREVLAAAAASLGASVGATEGASAALKRAELPKTQAQTEAAPAAESDLPFEIDAPEAAAPEAAAPEAAAPEAAAPEAAAPEAAAPAPAEAAAAPAEAAAAPAAAPADEEITDAHMRQYMDRQMERFCGKGWRDATDAATLKLRKECTRCFRTIAKTLGAEKPTALEGADRVKFVMALDEMTSDGKEVTWVPF